MQEGKVVYKNNIIAYKKYGTGDRILLAFMVLDKAAYRWGILEPYLGNKFTLIAFDLPFHGDTRVESEGKFYC